MSKKTHFNFCWLSNPCYHDWISHGSSNEEETWKLRKCVIRLSSVGETALQRHAGIKKHKQKYKDMLQVKNVLIPRFRTELMKIQHVQIPQKHFLVM